VLFFGGEKEKMKIIDAAIIMEEAMGLPLRDRTVPEIFEMCGACWVYSGKPGEPHALLASGRHSDAYFNVNLVTEFPNIRKELAMRLVRALDRFIVSGVDVVVSSTYAATTIGQAVADCLNAMFVFTEKDGQDQVWTGRFEIPSGAKVLQIEELITTLETTEKVKKAILEAGLDVEFINSKGKTIVGTIVHRPAKVPIDYESHKVASLWEREVHSWTKRGCPICRKGSEALKPKKNWNRFIGRI